MDQKHFMDIERAKFGGDLSASNGLPYKYDVVTNRLYEIEDK